MKPQDSLVNSRTTISATKQRLLPSQRLLYLMQYDNFLKHWNEKKKKKRRRSIVNYPNPPFLLLKIYQRHHIQKIATFNPIFGYVTFCFICIIAFIETSTCCKADFGILTISLLNPWIDIICMYCRSRREAEISRY